MATRPATREEIVQCDADLRELLGVMHERSAGGSSKQGRYLKPDTARRRYIKTVALPGLRYGKLPPDADYRILFLDPADWELPANKAEHDAWVKRHGRDPRTSFVPANPRRILRLPTSTVSSSVALLARARRRSSTVATSTDRVAQPSLWRDSRTREITALQ